MVFPAGIHCAALSNGASSPARGSSLGSRLESPPTTPPGLGTMLLRRRRFLDANSAVYSMRSCFPFCRASRICLSVSWSSACSSACSCCSAASSELSRLSKASTPAMALRLSTKPKTTASPEPPSAPTPPAFRFFLAPTATDFGVAAGTAGSSGATSPGKRQSSSGAKAERSGPSGHAGLPSRSSGVGEGTWARCSPARRRRQSSRRPVRKSKMASKWRLAIFTAPCCSQRLRVAQRS
mmetsp:Transcript_119930/g.267774  ORF Transcript_119930/g.267774 Transcript_119930/m.267774 type:complete len:238 (-) Transcript_119930:1139-1852(-)